MFGQRKKKQRGKRKKKWSWWSVIYFLTVMKFYKNNFSFYQHYHIIIHIDRNMFMSRQYIFIQLRRWNWNLNMRRPATIAKIVHLYYKNVNLHVTYLKRFFLVFDVSAYNYVNQLVTKITQLDRHSSFTSAYLIFFSFMKIWKWVKKKLKFLIINYVTDQQLLFAWLFFERE